MGHVIIVEGDCHGVVARLNSRPPFTESTVMERLRITTENDGELFLVHGDIGESRAEGIVNAWNRF